MQAYSFYLHFFPKGDEHGVWLWSSHHSWHLLSYSVISSSISRQRTQSFPGKIKPPISLYSVLLQSWTPCAKCNVYLNNTDTWQEEAGKTICRMFFSRNRQVCSSYKGNNASLVRAQLCCRGRGFSCVTNSFKGTFRTTSGFLQKATL